jgi:hypothetical protein
VINFIETNIENENEDEIAGEDFVENEIEWIN